MNVAKDQTNAQKSTNSTLSGKFSNPRVRTVLKSP